MNNDPAMESMKANDSAFPIRHIGLFRFPDKWTALIVGIWMVGILGWFFVRLEKLGLISLGAMMFLESLDLIGSHTFDVHMWWVRMADIGTTMLLLVSAWSVGFGLMRAVLRNLKADTITHLMAMALGFGLWSWFVLLTGLAGLISYKLYLSLAAASLGLSVWHWRLLRELAVESIVGQAPRLPCQDQSRTAASGALALQETSHRNGLSVFEWFLIACLGIGFVLQIIPAFAPELEYDTLEYHLGALSEYRKAGKIFFLEHNFYASMPSLTEMLYLWGIEVRSSTVAKLLHASFALLTAIGLAALGNRVHSRQTGLTAAALFYLLPYTTDLAGTARIDLATTFFAFMAGAMLYRCFLEDDQQSIWLAAIGTGLAMSTKYTAGPIVLLPMTVMLGIGLKKAWGGEATTNNCRVGMPQPMPQWDGVSRRRFATVNGTSLQEIVGRMCAFALVASIPVMPWLIKNWVFAGNPVYPIADRFFHSPYWGPELTELFHRVHSPSFASVADWIGLIKLAWQYSVDEWVASPSLVLFAPLFLLIKRPPARWTYGAWLGLFFYLSWWAFTFRPWRFLFPALPWFALVGALVYATMESRLSHRWLLRSALGCVLLFNLNCSFMVHAVDITNTATFPPKTSVLGVFCGRNSPEEYLHTRLFAQDWMNHNLSRNANVLFVGEARIFHTGFHVQSNTVFDKSIVGMMVRNSRSPIELHESMLGAGVTHIYINQSELNRLAKSYGYLKDMNWPLFREFLARHTRKLYENGVHSVYQIGNE